ncbi:MAG: cytochrome c3 family protein [Acidobacteriota bacterium]
MTRRTYRAWVVVLVAGSHAATLACTMVNAPPEPDRAEVFTPAHPDVASAARAFLGMKPAPVQPLEFPHDVHVAQGLTCTDYCHESASEGPVAGLPSLKTCMICHQAIATDRPRVQEMAALEAKGLDLAWQRVYGYAAEAHVRFDHSPHMRAKVECATCHGPIAEQTVAQLNVELTMGFCVTCHTARRASNDCLTCHY